jgi:hypothetical protein
VFAITMPSAGWSVTSEPNAPVRSSKGKTAVSVAGCMACHGNAIWLLSSMRVSRQLLANACIAASRVGS